MRISRWGRRSTLDRVRLVACAAGATGFLGMAPPVLASPHPLPWRLAGVAALVALAVLAVVTYRRRRPVPGDVLLIPGLMVLGGISHQDPLSTIGVCSNAIFAFSLYGSHRRGAVLAVAAGLAIPVVVSISPYSLGRLIPWHHPAVLGNLPQMALMALLMRILHSCLRAQELSARREGLLARTGSQFLRLRDLQALREAVTAAGEDLAELAPGTAVLVVERRAGSAIVVASCGALQGLAGAAVPDDLSAVLDALPPDVLTPLPQGPGALGAAAPQVGHWQGVALATAEVERFLLLGGTRRVDESVLDGYRTLADQFSLAEASCASYERLSHRASHDELTGLPTRALFLEQVGDAIDIRCGAVTLLNIDLDDFKQVNDVHGHAAGDELLVEAARRMREVCGGASVPARFGGDEFAVLLPTSLGGEDAAELARALCRRLTDPMVLSAATVTVGASIGVASWSAPLTAGDVLRCADIAMYTAKAMGKNRVEVFDPTRHGDVARHRLLEDHLISAVERGEVFLHYEPAVDPATGACVAVEARPHWMHPLLGLLRPEDFLPQALRSGRICDIGAHTLRTACTEVAAWSDADGMGEVEVRVDVAARQLADPTFADVVLDALAASGLPARRLLLELVDADDTDERTAHPQLRRLAGHGVRLVVDGFAGGRDCLTMHEGFPVSELKLDAEAVEPGADAHRVLGLAQAIGGFLGLRLTACAVATAEHAEELRALGVAAVQGPVVAPAMPATHLASWVARRARVSAASAAD
ncbi:diguanylate cyclase (GGDEF)-like protein [Kineococcus xinjiangensis]|uniref:Diguanylate cyclase (GGDEF)-like protein n=1 Tax=Kineococcus xinjiangensis TaxID=512762 RepID=A0A2S6IT80_9ACTN|nr:diguanylate cyclase [Kineococcus xinjiangensis]PPK97371.1 diguanylate cyclase (GGDEF)-like protein [Kineococcus xinjiangensis]